MAVIAHPQALALARQFTVSSTYQDAASIAASQFTPGRKYWLLARALLDQASVNNVAWCRVLHGATAFADSEMIDEPDTAVTGKMPFFWFHVWTAVAGEGIKVQYRAATGTEAGIQALVIDAIDITDGAFLFNSPNPTTVALLQDADSVNGNANISFTVLPENAGHDFLVMSSARHQEIDLVTSYGSRIVSSGTISTNQPQVIQEGEDGGLQGMQVKTQLRYFSALAAGDYTFAEKSWITGGVPTGGNRLSSKILAIDLNLTFRTHAGVYNGSEVDLSATDFATAVQSLAGYTPAVAGDQLVLGFFSQDADAAGIGGKMRLQADGVDVVANTTTNAYLQAESKDARDEMGFGAFGIVNLTAAAHTITLDGSTEAALAGRGANYRSLVVVSLETVPPPPVIAIEKRIGVSKPPLDLNRTDLWSDVELGGGHRLGTISHIIEGPTETISLSGEHSVSLTVKMKHPIVRLRETPADDSNLRINQVVRLFKNDGTDSEHRIYEVVRENQAGGRFLTVSARSIFQDLAFRGIVTRTTADGRSSATFEALGLPMETHIREFVLPAAAAAGAAYWNIGDLENTLPYDIVYDGDTPMSALKKIAAAAGNLELWHERASSGYLLFLKARRGNLAQPLHVRARANLISLQLREQADDQATRVYAFGQSTQDTRPTIGEGTWDVILAEAITDGWRLTLADPAGGAGPMQYEDQFLPPAISVDDPETSGLEIPPRFHIDYITGGDFLAPIIATNLADQSFDVQTTATPPAGRQKVRIVGDGLRRRILSVDHPAMVAKYGVRVGKIDLPEIPATDNLVPNPICRLWPLGSPLPTGWDMNIDANNTLVRETNPRYWQHGGQAMRVHWASPIGASPLVAPTAIIPHRAGGYLSFLLRVTTIVGRVQVDCYFNRNGVDPITGGTPPPFPVSATYTYVVTHDTGLFGPPSDIVLPDLTNVQLNVPEDLGIAAAWDLSTFSLYGGNCDIRIYPARNAPDHTECIVEAAQLTNSDAQLPLLEGNGGVRLHQAANERLALYAPPATSLSMDIVDLALKSGGRAAVWAFPFTPDSVGAEVTVEDFDSDVAVATRLLGWTRNWGNNKLRPQIQVSNERGDFTRTIAARTKANRHQSRNVPQGTRGLTYEP